eukprot:10171283-Alexandrium_andersonii.AAC.1
MQAQAGQQITAQGGAIRRQAAGSKEASTPLAQRGNRHGARPTRPTQPKSDATQRTAPKARRGPKPQAGETAP